MADLNEAVERGVINAFEKPNKYLGGRSMNQVLIGFAQGEIVPVVHGRWLETEDAWSEWYYRCSVCKHDWFIGDGTTPVDNKMNYCPVCGAKMDK
jgi:rubrerythrin